MILAFHGKENHRVRNEKICWIIKITILRANPSSLFTELSTAAKEFIEFNEHCQIMVSVNIWTDFPFRMEFHFNIYSSPWKLENLIAPNYDDTHFYFPLVIRQITFVLSVKWNHNNPLYVSSNKLVWVWVDIFQSAWPLSLIN